MTKTNTQIKDTNTVDTATAVQGTKGLPKVMISPTKEELKTLDKLPTKSAKIRYLAQQGYSTPENKYSGIGNYLGVRTQAVRNVLTQPLKRPQS